MKVEEIWDRTQVELRHLPPFFLQFLKNPIQGMRAIPQWEWPTIVAFWMGALMVSGALSGLVSRKLGDFVVGLLIFPFTGTAIALIASAFFYYTFYLFLKRDLPFKPLFTTVVLSGVPFLIFRVLIPVLPPADLAGLAFSAVLMVVGLTDSFGLPKNFVIKLLAGVFALFLLSWVYHQVVLTQLSVRPHMDVTPESFNILDKELKQSE